MNIPKSKKLIKQKAEKIMAEKLCKCIKKLDNKYEAKSIGICTKTIFNRKGYIRGQFECKQNQSVKIRKNKNKNKNKTRKNNNRKK
jgi:inner membrane protein involved in colicin E2 resistance